MRSRRAVFAAAAIAVGILLSVPSVASASAAAPRVAPLAYTEEPVVTTTEGPSSGLTPAVEAPAPEEDDAEQPWTARFLAPLVLLLGLVALIASISYYAVRIKRRYRVVS